MSVETAQCAVCSVQCVQCAMCSVQCAVCSVQCAVCSVQWSAAKLISFETAHPQSEEEEAAEPLKSERLHCSRSGRRVSDTAPTRSDTNMGH